MTEETINQSSEYRPGHCGHHGRHWFIVIGTVGIRTPFCERCGAPNPKWSLIDKEDYEQSGHVGRHPANSLSLRETPDA